MELKDFIKGVISDITNAVKECQEELDNGAIVSPVNGKSVEVAHTVQGDKKISYVDFELAVTASSETSANGERKGGIEVKSSFLGFQIGGKIDDRVTNESNKQINENISKIKFSIPIIYPTVNVQTRNMRPKANLQKIDG